LKKSKWKGPVYAISALTGDGTQQLLYDLQDALDLARDQDHERADKEAGDFEFNDPRFDPGRGSPA